MQKREIIFIQPVMTQPRFHFNRTIELSKYFNIEWIIGWKFNENDIYPESQINHKIMFIGKGKPRKKFKGLFDQFLFAFKVANIIRKMNADLIIIYSNRMNLLYPILCKKEKDKLVMTTFTPTVNPSKVIRLFWDYYERIGFSVYKRFLIATEAMVEAFGIQKKKTYLVRWGMNPISSIPKIFDRIRLLYLGTLSGRDIHKTIYGLKEYLDKNPEIEVERYDIIGTGRKEYTDLIEKAIKETELSNIVYLHGYLNDQEIIPYFDRANIGVAYLPNTHYYTNVVCTKVLEYLLSGIPSIAVNTNENKKKINDQNGVLIEDNEHSFAQGLHLMAQRFPSYSSEEIMKTVGKDSISYNVKNIIVPIFNRIIKEIENIGN